jgi:NAD+ diphosphatase
LAQPGFTGAGLDRADHLRLDEAQLAAMMANGDARLLGLAELDPQIDGDGRLVWSSFTEVVTEEIIFLGLDEGVPLFAPLVRTNAIGLRAWNVFRTLSMMSARDAAIWGAARSLNEWHNRHLFCGMCGAPTAPFRAGWGRRCTGCKAEQFPRVDPVVIMLAEHGGRILLGRQPQYPAGRYSALAGFVEPGESIEEAVQRELFEEAGIAVSDVRYVASQPWPFPGSLMIACIGRAESDKIRLDTNELEDAIWVERAGVAAALAGDPGAPFQAPPPFAIANTLLTRWLEHFQAGL